MPSSPPNGPPPLANYTEAAALVQSFIRNLPSHSPKNPEKVALGAALGRVLAEPILADRDQPPFPRSTRDGYACRALDANTHEFLRLTGQGKAGEYPSTSLDPGAAWEIMTGAPVPQGADAVFMIEHAEQVPGLAQIRLQPARTLQAAENIVPQGAEGRQGQELAPAGTRITPAQIALAAQCGMTELLVIAKVRVAILSTGDELVAVQEIPGPSQIRNSNSPMLAALVTAAAGTPIVFPAVPDTESAVDEAVRLVTSSRVAADLVLISGGISAGRFDLVEDALTHAGAEFFFRGVALQPGKPAVFGQLPRPSTGPLPFFALPGNPVSSAVTFHLFAAPLLAALGSHPHPNSQPLPRFALVKMSGEWRGKPGLTRFLPAWCDFSIEPMVRLVPWQGSGDIAAFSRSNCFLVIPAETSEIASGTLVSILLA